MIVEKQVAEARHFFGPEAKIMFDPYMAWGTTETLDMAERLGKYNMHWLEDVLTPDCLDEQAEIRKNISPIKLAGSEHEFTHHGYDVIRKSHALDIWQPDITWCGGLTAALRILEIANEAGVSVVLHRGGEIWGLQFIAVTSCDNFAETHPSRWEDDADILWLDEPRVRNGFISPSDRPGFGVRLNESLL